MSFVRHVFVRHIVGQTCYPTRRWSNVSLSDTSLVQRVIVRHIVDTTCYCPTYRWFDISLSDTSLVRHVIVRYITGPTCHYPTYHLSDMPLVRLVFDPNPAYFTKPDPSLTNPPSLET